MKKCVVDYLVACCHGVSQVMLQRAVFTGVLFLLGILAGGWPTFVLGLVSLMFVTLLSPHNREGYVDGLWGFNALLVGCAASVFPCPNGLFLALMAFSTVAMKRILDRWFSSLTLPFILSTWIFICASRWCGSAEMVESSVSVDVFIGQAPDVVAGLFKGLSEVFLADSWVGGFLILAGLLMANWRAAAWALAGSAIGMACAMIGGCPWGDIVNGLWGFSPALTAVAIGVTFRPQGATWSWTFVTTAAIILTFGIQLTLSPLLALIDLPALTLPFCCATWIVLYGLRKLHPSPKV